MELSLGGDMRVGEALGLLLADISGLRVWRGFEPTTTMVSGVAMSRWQVEDSDIRRCTNYIPYKIPACRVGLEVCRRWLPRQLHAQYLRSTRI